MRGQTCLPPGSLLKRVARHIVLREPARFLIACQGLGYIEDRPMLLPLMLSLVGSALAPANAASARVVSDDPPIKVWLNHDNYYRGDKARVNVRLDDDGYVVVLRADADGRVRVLFPRDPGDEAFVRGGETRSEEHTSELQSRRDLVCRLL